MLCIHQISLHHFRNYAFEQLQTNDRSVILTGSNGAGKTNILEAVSLLSPGRGFRKAKLSEMRQQSSGKAWVIAADISGQQGDAHLGTSLEPEAEAERRLVKIDGEKARSQTALAEHLAMSWHTPQMDGLFVASDGERRRYLDRLIYAFDSAHLSRVSAYEHSMRERNKLLAMGLGADPAWLSALEEQMAQAAVAIASARQELIGRLNQHMDVASGAFPQAQLAMQGAVEATLTECPVASDAEEQVQLALTASRSGDAAAGRALYGAHRSQFQVMHLAKQAPAAQCSTGEQKALLMCILLAHARARKEWLGAAPILLLDETVAHLDAARRVALAETLLGLDAQVWMTGTDAADFEAFEGFSAHFEVCDGQLRKRTA